MIDLLLTHYLTHMIAIGYVKSHEIAKNTNGQLKN